ncbi:oligosaccharide flippase family protein [Pseudomonas sp. JS3066]|uniref:oligosaccharide flippase family protein n=1 Tax=Pseudomonas sp. JS3066 TaxID=3090665 RepID=UPI002E7B923A|nr:oligosaccharide flippase family protein [Pseudomonas sp. JS3066]WVK95000.1 oligosaccharide flippase family protein [Pseudomonas sp. JS3066]
MVKLSIRDECYEMGSGLNNKSFFKNVRSVLLGGLGAQAISLGVMLIVVKLYSPSEVGLFYVWMSFLAILEVLVTARYESAFFSIKNEDESYVIGKLIVYIALWLSLVTFLLLTLVNGFTNLLPRPIPEFMLGLALAMLGMGLNKAVLSLLALLSQFKRLGLAKVILAASIAVAQIAAGLLAYGVAGLIYGQVVGILLATLCAFLWLDKAWLSSLWKTSNKDMLASFRLYSNFPKYSLPADLINTIANQLPLILIASRFGAEAAGWFALTLKVLGAPISLLATSILDVFKSQAAKDYREFGNCRHIFLQTFKVLAALAVLPFVVLWFTSEWLFTILFGAEWAEAGHYAAILVPFFYCRFVVSPLSYTLYIAQKQKLDLIWQSCLLVISYVTFSYSNSAVAALSIYAMAYAAMYVIYFFLSYYCARGRVA